MKKLEADLRAASKAVADAKTELAAAEKGSEETAKRLAAVRKVLTVSKSTVVRPYAGHMSFPMDDVTDAATAAWIHRGVHDGCVSGDTSCSGFLNALAAKLAVYAGFHAQAAKGQGKLRVFREHELSTDVLLVLLDPLVREGIPRTVEEIDPRIAELASGPTSCAKCA